MLRNRKAGNGLSVWHNEGQPLGVVLFGKCTHRLNLVGAIVPNKVIEIGVVDDFI